MDKRHKTARKPQPPSCSLNPPPIRCSAHGALGAAQLWLANLERADAFAPAPIRGPPTLRNPPP